MTDPRLRTRLLFETAGDALEDLLATWGGPSLVAAIFGATVAQAARALLPPAPAVPLESLLALEGARWS